jgi:predicted nucleic acid-binding protein
MIVVDANVVALFFLEGSKTSLARQVRERDEYWIVPGIWRHEFLNILVTSCLFAKLPLQAAERVWRDAGDLLRGCVYEPDMTDVLSGAVERLTTAYDAEYVMLAKARRVPCVTEDALLRKAFPETGVSMVRFLGLEDAPGLVKESSPAYTARRKR